MLAQSAQWKTDLDAALHALPCLSALSGRTVWIAGASGLIGSALADLLIAANETLDRPIALLLAGRDPERLKRRFGDAPNVSFLRFDALEDAPLSAYADAYVYAASNATPRLYGSEPAKTLLGSVIGLWAALEAATESGGRLLFVSSSEVYGKKAGAEPFTEEEGARLDPLSARSAYAVGKCAGETLCAAFGAERGTDTVVVRPGHVYGPTASPLDNRVASLWAYAAAKGEPIVMKSDGAQRRSWCHCLDCAAAIVIALIFGERGAAYNVGDPASDASIAELAEKLASCGGVPLIRALPSDAERKVFNPMPVSTLNPKKLFSIGFRPVFSLNEGLLHTVTAIREARAWESF